MIIRPLAALTLLLPAAALAQSTGGKAVDAYSGLVVGSGRIVGLAGAYVAVAEGLGGAAVNPASVAHRRRDLAGAWELDGTFSASARRTDQDLDNDGGRDAALSGSAHLELGGGLQWQRLGLGLLARDWLSRGPRSAEGSAGIETVGVTLPCGYSGWNDRLVLGASFIAASGAVVQYRPDGEEARRLGYSVQEYGAGALWRPRGRPFRLGAAFVSGGRARLREEAPAGFTGPVPQAFHFPWIASAGASLWLGRNAHLRNEPALRELATHPEAVRVQAYDPEAAQPVLVAVQLDVVGPTRNAVTVASALVSGVPGRASGADPSLVPRAGVEWEALHRWLRIRGGYYLEPSRTGGAARSHVTFGAEGRLPFWPWDLQLGLGGDLADRYSNGGLTLGLWSEAGPVAPPGR